MEGKCYFDWKFKCNHFLRSTGLINIKAKQIQNIVRCSQLYQDNIDEKLQPQFDSNLGLILQAHKVCIEKNLHPKEDQKAMKCHAGDADVSISAPKRAKQSEVPKFNFQQHCIYCGEECLVKNDPKNLSRWRPVYICTQFVRIGQKQSLKHEILKKCDE